MHGGWLAAILNLLGMGGGPAAAGTSGPLCARFGSAPALTARFGSAPALTARFGSEVC